VNLDVRTATIDGIPSGRKPGLVIIDSFHPTVLGYRITKKVTGEQMAVSNVISDHMVRELNRVATRVLRQGRRFSTLLNMLGGTESAIPEVLSEFALRFMTRERLRDDLVRLLNDSHGSEDEIARYMHRALRNIVIDMIRERFPGIAGGRVRVPASVAEIGIWAIWVFDRFLRHGDSVDSACRLMRDVLATEADARREFEQVAWSYGMSLGLGSRDVSDEEFARKKEKLLADALQHARELCQNSSTLECFVEQVWDISDGEGAFGASLVDESVAIDSLGDNRDPRAYERCGEHCLLAWSLMLYFQLMLVFWAVRATNRNLAGLSDAILRTLNSDLHSSEMTLLIATAALRELGAPNILAIQNYANENGIKGTAAYEFKHKMQRMMARLQNTLETDSRVIYEFRQRGIFDEHGRLDQARMNRVLVKLVSTPDVAVVRDVALRLVRVFCGRDDNRERQWQNQHDITLDIEALRADVHAFVDHQPLVPCEQVYE